ncbi:unnamed protein product [Orchesella dallaii]|uniref:Uncharacterized protein n=1 Tax=Orchesella dallaii TaxID=48710 RepID=A0ABP1Q7J3_9HEXA
MSSVGSNGGEDGGSGARQPPQHPATAPLIEDNNIAGSSGSGSNPIAVAQIEPQGQSGQVPASPLPVPGGSVETAQPNQLQAVLPNQHQLLELHNRSINPLVREIQQRTLNNINTLVKMDNQNNQRLTDSLNQSLPVQNQLLRSIELDSMISQHQINQIFGNTTQQQTLIPHAFVQHQTKYAYATYAPNLITQQQGEGVEIRIFGAAPLARTTIPTEVVTVAPTATVTHDVRSAEPAAPALNGGHSKDLGGGVVAQGGSQLLLPAQNPGPSANLASNDARADEPVAGPSGAKRNERVDEFQPNPPVAEQGPSGLGNGANGIVEDFGVRPQHAEGMSRSSVTLSSTPSTSTSGHTRRRVKFALMQNRSSKSRKVRTCISTEPVAGPSRTQRNRSSKSRKVRTCISTEPVAGPSRAQRNRRTAAKRIAKGGVKKVT